MSNIKFKPILDDSNESETIRVKKYLLEFLEELRKINSNKTSKTIDIVEEIKVNDKVEQQPIIIEIKIVRPRTPEPKPEPKLEAAPSTSATTRTHTPYPNEINNVSSNNNNNDNDNEIKKPIAKMPTKSDALRHIPSNKLTVFEDITLKKIRNDYKPTTTYFESGSRSNKFYKETRSLKEDSRKHLKTRQVVSSRPIFSRLDADPILKQLLENQYKDKINYNYNFQQEFNQHLRQNDPYYNYSKLNTVF